jgi:hypothetical protein
MGTQQTWVKGSDPWESITRLQNVCAFGNERDPNCTSFSSFVANNVWKVDYDAYRTWEFGEFRNQEVEVTTANGDKKNSFLPFS